MEKKRRYLQFVLFHFLIFSHCINSKCQQQLNTPIHLSTSPPSPSTPSTQPTPPKPKTDFRRITISIFLGALTGLALAILVALLIRMFITFLQKTPILKGPVIFSPRISQSTLQSALASDTHLLGSSPNGNYYRTVLDNGLTIAVKTLEPFRVSHSKSVKRKLQQELEILAGLRHRNLMSLRAYVRENDRYSLIYDYVSSGSLEDAMNRVRVSELELKWDVRLRIAIGVVKGLQYLHFGVVPQVLHYNLKPSNVMLDAEFEPRLADCGLANIVSSLNRTISCYMAPECFQDQRYTDKSDIFSFGMILGVLLTGRSHSDPFFENGANGGCLSKWLRHLQQAGEVKEALDKSIIGEEVEEDEMLMVVRIAVVCLSDSPAERPSSDELVHMLTQLHSF